MTDKDEFMLVLMVCFLVLAYLFKRFVIDQPTAPSPRRLNGKSSTSGVGTDGVAPMASADCGSSSSDCGGGGGGD